MEFKLIIKKINNTLTPDEEVAFNNWYNESKVHQDYFLNVKNNYQKDTTTIDEKMAWEVLNKKLISKKRNNYWKYAVAASIALLLSLYFYNINKTDTPKLNEFVNQPNYIKTGTDKATLTLENGTLIALEKGKDYVTKNVQSHGQKLIYNKANKKETLEIVYNYLTIPRGGQFYVELSDNTKVWLNSESQLKYPVAFTEDKPREVELVYGEAYFDVSPSEDHKNTSFKVITKNQKIEVLGTEFNIKAYEDETNIKTTLVEGKVNLKINDNNKILMPNEQAVTQAGNDEIKINHVTVYNEISWKNGIFSFNKKPLRDIMIVLSRWYDIDIFFENKEIEKIEFNGVLRKSQPIEEILSTIKNTNTINYTIKDKIITLK